VLEPKQKKQPTKHLLLAQQIGHFSRLAPEMDR
jgi:hypothetical protein